MGVTNESETQAVYRRIFKLLKGEIGESIVGALEDARRDEITPWCLLCQARHPIGSHDPRCANCDCDHKRHERDGRCTNGAHSWSCDCVEYVPMTPEAARVVHVAEAVQAAEADNGVTMNLVKLTGHFSYEVVEAIQRLARSRGVSGAEVIRQAVSSEQFVDRVLSEGGDILVLNRSGEIDRIVFY